MRKNRPIICPRSIVEHLFQDKKAVPLDVEAVKVNVPKREFGYANGLYAHCLNDDFCPTPRLPIPIYSRDSGLGIQRKAGFCTSGLSVVGQSYSFCTNAPNGLLRVVAIEVAVNNRLALAVDTSAFSHRTLF
jgi:hypothetical protein